MKKNYSGDFSNIKLTAKLYLLVLILFTIFRLILFFTQLGRITASVATTDIFHAFFMGMRFDIVISGYLLLLPYLLLTLLSFSRFHKPTWGKILFWFVFATFTLAFLVCAVDIPYFNQFFSRFSVTAFEWMDNPVFVFKMIAEEPRYWLIMLPFLLMIAFFFLALKRLMAPLNRIDGNTFRWAVRFLASLLFLGLIFLGIRGRIDEKSPIRVGTAYFCNNAFLNQLGLNPNFTLMRSFLDSRKDENKSIHLMDDMLALANVQKYLGITKPDGQFPLARKIQFSPDSSLRYNVVMVIMESMSAAKMSRHGNTKNLTPFLDRISTEGIYFENIYSAGIHTYNGIFSSLFSFPALFRQHPMKESAMLKYHGIATTLKNIGYSTIYFTTHDGQFDNVEGFLKENDFDRIVSKPDYPSDKVKTTLGVPDDYLFEFAVPVLSGLSKKNKPFFAAFMTASDHGPYYIPDYYKPRNKELRDQIVEYADYSLEKLIKLASKQAWFKNTLFVFVADHGAPIDATYDMSLDYNHTPLIFYNPWFIRENKVYSNPGGQIDIFPSIMGFLNLSYTNNTLGTDLFRQKRPCIFFNGDDKYGVLDNDWFLVVGTDHSISLYRYRQKDTHNYADEKPDIVRKMREYAESNLQTFQYIVTAQKQ